MADCAACGTRVEEGVTKCPQCGATLKVPGSFIQVVGWVVSFMSSIPIVVGVVTLEQKDFKPFAAGIALLLVGLGMVIYGRVKSRSVPPTTRPSAAPAGPPPIPGGPSGH